MFNVSAGQLLFDAEGLSKVGELMAIYGLVPAGLPVPPPEEEGR